MDDFIRVYDEPYLHTSQVMWHDKSLSLKERGLLATLLSLQHYENWKYSIRGLQELVPDGKSAIAAGMKSLEEHGYLMRVQQHECGKFKMMKYFICDKPVFLDQKIVQDVIKKHTKNAGFHNVPQPDFPCPENQSAENPSAENQPQLINKRINKENYKEEDYSACVREDDSTEVEKDVASFEASFGVDEIHNQITGHFGHLYGDDETQRLERDVGVAVELMSRFIRERKDFKTKNGCIPYKVMAFSFFKLNPIKTAWVMQKLNDAGADRMIGNVPKYLLSMLYNEAQIS